MFIISFNDNNKLLISVINQSCYINLLSAYCLSYSDYVFLSAAVEILNENINLASFESSVDANEDDISFLADLLNNPILHGLIRVS